LILIRIFAIFLALNVVVCSGDKVYEFKIGECFISANLHDGRQDTTVLLSNRFLEKTICDRLKEVGIQPSASGGKFVEFQENQILIRGMQGPVDFKILVDGRFFQYRNQRDPDKVHFDFTLSLDKGNESFLGSLLNFVTLPVGLVFEAVLNVIFAATHVKADVMDYFEIDVKGSFTPMAFLKRIAASFLNIFLPSEDKITIKRAGKIELKMNPKAKTLLNKLRNLEIGQKDEALLVYFY